jgi:guanine deaminase
METTKIFLLFCLVSFGAYSEYQAGKTVQKIKTRKEKSGLHKNVINKEEGFMRRAIALSHIAIEKGHGDPFGSVIVRDGEILGEGWNETKVSHDPSAHAEVVAIRDATKRLSSKDLRGATIYASAQPCAMCLSLIYMTGIEKIFYCISAEEITSFTIDLKVAPIFKELSKPQHERAIPEHSILHEEAAKSIEQYREASEK